MTLMASLLNVVDLLLTLPNHVIFVRYLWRLEGQADIMLVVVTPLNVIALLTTSVDGIRIQALCGMAAAAIQYVTARRIERAGMRIL